MGNELKIEREEGKLKASVIIDKYDVMLFTRRNGYQSTGQPITPDLARITIEVLQEYLELAKQSIKGDN